MSDIEIETSGIIVLIPTTPEKPLSGGFVYFPRADNISRITIDDKVYYDKKEIDWILEVDVNNDDSIFDSVEEGEMFWVGETNSDIIRFTADTSTIGIMEGEHQILGNNYVTIEAILDENQNNKMPERTSKDIVPNIGGLFAIGKRENGKIMIDKEEARIKT